MYSNDWCSFCRAARLSMSDLLKPLSSASSENLATFTTPTPSTIMSTVRAAIVRLGRERATVVPLPSTGAAADASCGAAEAVVETG
jgi:hypothetical protein